MKLSNISPEKITPYARNAKIHPEKQINSLKKSIEAYGFVNPIIVDADLEVVAGHARLQAAIELKLTEIPVLIIKFTSAANKRAYAIADNKLSERGIWDQDLLLQEVLAIESNIDIDSLGLEPNLLKQLQDEVKIDTSEEILGDNLAILVKCKNEVEQEFLYEKLHKEGYECKTMGF